MIHVMNSFKALVSSDFSSFFIYSINIFVVKILMTLKALTIKADSRKYKKFKHWEEKIYGSPNSEQRHGCR